MIRGDLRERVLAAAGYLRAEDVNEWTAAYIAEVMTGGRGFLIDAAALERVLQTLALDGVLTARLAADGHTPVYALASRA